MKKIISYFFLLSSCTAAHQTVSQGSTVLSHGERKQKQKVIVLQKKLATAEEMLLHNQKEVEMLRQHLSDAELDAVEFQIDALEKKWQSNPDHLTRSFPNEASMLFLDEREKLHTIIQSGPGSRRAQDLLDRVLQLITQVSDSYSHQD